MLKRDIGKKGELIATEFLIKNGHQIVEKNYRTKFGEIDIISFKDGVYYFNEVKTVKRSDFHPFEQITPIKLKKIFITLEIYRKLKNIYNFQYSISAIGIILKNSDYYKIYYEKSITL